MKAVQLTKRLLDFSRKSTDSSVNIRIHALISETIELVKTGLGHGFKIEKGLYDGDPVIKGNATQIQNALINLIFNARDSMSEGGAISVETSLADISKDTVNPLMLSSGRYINVSVRDSGTGIDPDIIDKIFEPFFTTKEKDAGTGLGLVSVTKAAKDHGGTVAVDSEVGKGSVFHIYLPVSN